MKVIDCFPFFNELDLLEIRLNELKDVVDIFVLTESPQTFTGKDKPLFFQENKERFKEFNIVHTVFESNVECHAMERERKQKQFNLDYAFDNIFEQGDMIMFGDCDEIPKASVVSELLKEEWEAVGLLLTQFYYYLNCRQVGGTDSKRASVRLVRPKQRIIYDTTRRSYSNNLIKDAGYHFSYLGDIAYKLASWGHADRYNRSPYNDPGHLKRCKEAGKDFLMRDGRRKIDFEFIKDLSYLPDYVLNNLERFEKWIKR